MGRAVVRLVSRTTGPAQKQVWQTKNVPAGLGLLKNIRERDQEPQLATKSPSSFG